MSIQEASRIIHQRKCFGDIKEAIDENHKSLETENSINSR
jgi:hypothetical protein